MWTSLFLLPLYFLHGLNTCQPVAPTQSPTTTPNPPTTMVLTTESATPITMSTSTVPTPTVSCMSCANIVLGPYEMDPGTYEGVGQFAYGTAGNGCKTAMLTCSTDKLRTVYPQFFIDGTYGLITPGCGTVTDSTPVTCNANGQWEYLGRVGGKFSCSVLDTPDDC